MGSFDDKRVSPRIPAKVPISIEGRDADANPVRAETYTPLINEAGALIALAASFRLNEGVRVTNRLTGAKTEGRIAWRSAEPLDGRWSYGIALLDAPPDFWQAK
ncbi:MAG: hypothetical protein ACRD3A_05810 [Terriglobales bacterium]